MTPNYERMYNLLKDTGGRLIDQGIAHSAWVHLDHDIHAFYNLASDPSQVIHVQGYPGLSSENQARVWARLMDDNRREEIRKAGSASIGNEHEATIRSFPNFEIGIFIPFDPGVLEGKIKENL